MVDRIFTLMGRLAARHRWSVIAGWVIVAAAITVLAPHLDEVTSSNTRDFLPANAPFLQAETNLKQTFPADYARAGATFVVESTQGPIHDEPAWNYLTQLTEWLRSKDAPQNLSNVSSPVGGSALLASALVAHDDRAAIIILELTTDTQDPATIEALNRFRTYANQIRPDGLNIAITGVSPIVIDYAQATIDSVDRTTGITVLLVIIILILVYRSPVSPMVPLVTVAMSYLISRGLIAWIAQHTTISSYVSVMLVVVLFGAGTDYCLFLISRFGEELSADGDSTEAIVRTVHRVAETLTSSAGTVVVGFATMLFAEMGLFRNSGPSLAIGIVVVLLAGLTLTPALLAVLGKRTFWPRQPTQRSSSQFYGRLSSLIAAHPVVTILLIVIALLPLAAAAVGQRSTYDVLADLPEQYESRVGFKILESHMGGGQMQPLTVVVGGLDPASALNDIDRWTRTVTALPGVADVRSISNPLGSGQNPLVGITRIDKQLSLAADLLGTLSAGSGQPDPKQVSQAAAALPFVQDYLAMLAQRFPQMADNADLKIVRQTVDGLPIAVLTGSVASALNTLQTHLIALSQAFAKVEGAFYLPDALPPAVVNALGGKDPLVSLTDRYLTTDRTAGRFEVILQGNPFSEDAMNVVMALRSTLPGGGASVSGTTAIMADLRDTMNRDMMRSFAFVLLGILLVLVFLLRAAVSPIYLILTILLSYGATIGITRLLSRPLFGTDELTWWVPFFMFVLLVALGMDYNIFLMGRLKEEVNRTSIGPGVNRTLVATGAIITSAGIIMAGTFSAMTSSMIVGLRQLGFAVSIGVLLDTFVIRTALVPAIALCLDRWNWWPFIDRRKVVSAEETSQGRQRVDL